MTTPLKPKTTREKAKVDLKKKIVKKLLAEGVQVTMSVAKALDEFIDVDVADKIEHLLEKGKERGMREVMDDYTSTLKPKKNIKNKTKKEKQPMHDCPAFGKEISTPKAFNSKTNKFCYKCPFCGYQEDIK